jgi:hypothetical protein
MVVVIIESLGLVRHAPYAERIGAEGGPIVLRAKADIADQGPFRGQMNLALNRHPADASA